MYNKKKHNSSNGFTIMNTNEQYLFGRLLWIGISLGIIFAILLYAPFPLSIVLAITAFILLNFYIRRKVIQRVNTKFGSTSSYSSSSLSYSCINCGTKHNELACPECGSKMKRARIRMLTSNSHVISVIRYHNCSSCI
jgi:uncharacterized paraquat-inducible protein A